MIKETKLIITHMIDDQNPKTYKVTVDGSLEDKLFCYGLLEYAQDIIQDYNRPKATEVFKFSLPSAVRSN